MPRERLPNRRKNETITVTHEGNTYAVTLGFDPATGEVREIFSHGAKVGSAKSISSGRPTMVHRGPGSGRKRGHGPPAQTASSCFHRPLTVHHLISNQLNILHFFADTLYFTVLAPDVLPI